jgi:parallel beta-helix repeat protein
MSVKNLSRRWYILIAIVVLAFSMLYINLNSSLPQVERKNPTYTMEKHTPIIIGSVGDLTRPEDTAGCRCVRGGSGTRDDPFIIGWWEIEVNGSYGITIGVSREVGLGVSVKLTSLRIEGSADQGYVGIALTLMSYSEIENSTIIDSRIAVSLYESDHNQISQLNVQRCATGVMLETSGDDSLLNSSISSCGVAVWVRGPSNRVSQNRISTCSAGINVDGDGGRSANANVIEGNTITDGSPEAYGIALYKVGGGLVTGNTVARMGWGIALADSSNGNTISHNTVFENKRSGIYVSSGSSNNTITSNGLHKNGDGISSFDLHEENDPGLNVWKSNQFDTRNRDDIG